MAFAQASVAPGSSGGGGGSTTPQQFQAAFSCPWNTGTQIVLSPDTVNSNSVFVFYNGVLLANSDYTYASGKVTLNFGNPNTEGNDIFKIYWQSA